jgi:hypothetical protein
VGYVAIGIFVLDHILYGFPFVTSLKSVILRSREILDPFANFALKVEHPLGNVGVRSFYDHVVMVAHHQEQMNTKTKGPTNDTKFFAVDGPNEFL